MNWQGKQHVLVSGGFIAVLLLPALVCGGEVAFTLRAPSVVTGAPGSTVHFTAVVQLEQRGVVTGAQGWSVSVGSDHPACAITAATTEGTVAALAPAGLRQPSSFERSEVIDPDEPDNVVLGVHSGAVSAVLLAYAIEVKLNPAVVSHDILRLNVEVAIPWEGSTTCHLRFVDGLVGSGQPVDNNATYQGQTVVPVLEDAQIVLGVEPAAADGKALFEYYWTDGEPFLASLWSLGTYPDWPDAMEWRTRVEGNTDWRDAYGTRVRGYLHPPQDGYYNFWIASDNQSVLWLSSSADPAMAAPIAAVGGWTPPRDFDNAGGGQGGDDQASDPVYLRAGRKYYIEVHHIEGAANDNLAVAWQGPGMAQREIINGYLSSVDGLKAEYFDNATLAGGPARVRVDPQIDFNWDIAEILPGRADGCSVRWTGALEIPWSGVYTFHVVTDDGARLWIDDGLIIDAWQDQPPTEYASTPITLSAGRRYRIRLEWYENAGGAVCQLLWSSDSMPKHIIPSHCLCPTTVDASQAGLVAWWKCDDGAGSILYDSSGNGHHGVLHGNVTRIGGATGGALSFGGNVGDYVDLGNWDPSEVTGELTVAHWVYWSGSGETWQGTLGKRDSWRADDMMWQMELTTQSDPPGYILFMREGKTYPPYGFTLPVGQWVHVAATFDGTTLTLYRNGRSVTASAFSFGSDTTAAMTLGACEAYGVNPWKGYIDDVRLYNRALEADEFRGLMVEHHFECPLADTTGDCRVDLADFLLLAADWLAEGSKATGTMIPNASGFSEAEDEAGIPGQE